MRKMISRLFLLLVCLPIFLSVVYAVEMPSLEMRKKAEATHKKLEAKKLQKQRASGCKYGRVAATGKCYEPREGQLFRNPETGNMEIKKVDRINLPWKQKR